MVVQQLLQMSICVFFASASGSWFLSKTSWCKALRVGSVFVFCADLCELMMKHCTVWKGILLQTSWQLGSRQKSLSGRWQYVTAWRHNIWSRCDTHSKLQNRVPYRPSKTLPNLHFPWYRFRGEFVCLFVRYQGQHTRKKKVLFLPFWFSPLPLNPPQVHPPFPEKVEA